MTTWASTDYGWGAGERRSAGWWVLLLTGIAWVIVGVLVLDADFDSALAIGYLVGGYLIASGVMEFLLVGVSLGWKWLHAVLGVLFVIGGVFAFTEPFQTFAVLAGLVGFFLVVKGVFDFVMALATRHISDLWWLLLIAGIVQVVLGIWASGYPGRSAVLLILWVGVGALIRGITQIVASFEVRRPDAAVA
jgi:uncharacterized membrane protein HdeD (DUF308 family)